MLQKGHRAARKARDHTKQRTAFASVLHTAQYTLQCGCRPRNLARESGCCVSGLGRFSYQCLGRWQPVVASVKHIVWHHLSTLRSWLTWSAQGMNKGSRPPPNPLPATKARIGLTKQGLRRRLKFVRGRCSGAQGASSSTCVGTEGAYTQGSCPGSFSGAGCFFHTAPKVGQMLGATPPAGSSMAKSLGPLPLPRW